MGFIARAARSTATLACLLAVYYGLPLRAEHVSDLAGLVVFVGGIAGLIWLVGRQVRHFVARPPDAGARLLGVLTVLYAVIVFFSLGYYLIQRNMPGEFDGLSTRTDALYYTVVPSGPSGTATCTRWVRSPGRSRWCRSPSTSWSSVFWWRWHRPR